MYVVYSAGHHAGRPTRTIPSSSSVDVSVPCSLPPLRLLVTSSSTGGAVDGTTFGDALISVVDSVFVSDVGGNMAFVFVDISRRVSSICSRTVTARVDASAAVMPVVSIGGRTARGQTRPHEQGGGFDLTFDFQNTLAKEAFAV